MKQAIVIGGGFYGAMVALHLHRRQIPVTLIEAKEALLTRASYVNQARVHNGYHYPRSFNTAYRSRFNSPRFVAEFKPAVVDNFQHLYAIIRHRSKVSAHQFAKFAKAIEAPIREASLLPGGWFNMKLVEQVFAVEEFAFDAAVLAKLLLERLAEAKIPIRFSEAVLEVTDTEVITTKGSLPADLVFNCTYAQLEKVAGGVRLGLKHELTEIALVHVPEAFGHYGVTVMDGPFFSVMPFPAEQLHSFTHVRYTPHASQQGEQMKDPSHWLSQTNLESRFGFMQRDAARYMPVLGECQYVRSHMEVKTVMQANEVDDGRPILFQQTGKNCYAILGSKMDNIYDVLERIDAVLGIGVGT